IYDIYEDSQGRLWLGTGAGLDKFDPLTETFEHYLYDPENPISLGGEQVSAIMEDSKGSLWVGTWDGGISRLSPITDTFVRYQYRSRSTGGLSNNTVLSILEASDGVIWIGTAGGGLNRFDSATGRFTVFTEENGLPNNVIYGMLEDRDHFLWLSTNHGLSRFDLSDLTFRNYTVTDGLQSNEFNSNAYGITTRGEMYFGGINGLNFFDPLSISINTYVPPIMLTSLTQNGEPFEGDPLVESLREITLVWPQNSFEFEFSALSYGQPNKNEYAYKLENFETDWNFIGTKHNSRYTNLPGGTYTLLLKGSNGDGVWNQTPLRIRVTVVPPIWQTNWFRIILGFGLASVVAAAYTLRVASVQRRSHELERVVQQRTRELKKRNTEMEALYQADEKIIRTVSINQVYQALVTVAVEILNADRSLVLAWDADHTYLIPRVSHGFQRKTLDAMKFTQGDGVVGRVLSSGEPIIVSALDLNDLRPDLRAAILEEGIQSFIHLPIKVDAKVIAIFNVGFTRPNAINDDIVRLYTALVQRASLSIANMELFEQTKELAVIEERNRLARDLHDSAKQKAFAALAQLGTVNSLLNLNGDGVKPHITEAETLVYEVIQELTFLIQEIYPIALQEKGLATTLREYSFEWENRNDIELLLTVQNERSLPLETEQAIYRVIQEALANVSRHSRAKNVEISLIYQPSSLEVEIADDGCGFDLNQKAKGMGFRSMRERLGSVRGTIETRSVIGQGTCVKIQVPIKN
ncbi:MAG: two-component regulator propeller domain-containing protein, partial [Chloroflexota bacterium]